MIFFTKTKPETPDRPFGFCMFLRKYLNNARVRDVCQKEFERIIEVDFSTKESKLILVIELFRKGNLVLCDDNMKIISPFENQHWSDREIKKNEIYKYPELRKDPFSLSKEQIKHLLENSDKESVVKFLAIELSLGGVYAEEICLRAKIDKNEKPNKTKKAEEIAAAIEELKNEKPAPRTIYKNGSLIDIAPLDLKIYDHKNITRKEFETFSEAIDSELAAEAVAEKQQTQVISKHQKEIGKVERMIREQEKTIQNFTLSYDENQRKGEMIYENYQQINDIIGQLRKAREKHSWKEIKEKLKNHRIIKQVNEKESKITIELD